MSVTGKFAEMFVALAIFAVVFGAVMFVAGRTDSVRAPGWRGVVFAGPALVLLAVGLIYPALRTIWQSFFNANGSHFAGLHNFVQIFTQGDLVKVLVTTIAWVVIVPVVATFIGLVYAVVINESRFEKVAKAAVFLPTAISFVAAAVIWSFVYQYEPKAAGTHQIGLANQFLVWLGFKPVQFLITQPINTLALIVVMIWIQAGFAMVMLSAAIKGIPQEVSEAARIDGASGIRMFTKITIPSIKPSIVIVLTTISIAVLKIFDIVQTMTGGNYGTNTISNEFYNESFNYFNFGIGSALAVIMFVFIIPIVLFNLRQSRKAAA